jgi:ribonuclease HI
LVVSRYAKTPGKVYIVVPLGFMITPPTPIINPKGTHNINIEVIRYAWGLSTMSNNEVEVYALLKGINLALSTGVRRIVICGDSMLVIRALVTQNIVGGNVFMGVLSRINALLKKFKAYSCFHIKRELNSDTDREAKEGAHLRIGVIKVNGSTLLHHIP